jgi:hypothetical protein
MPEVRFERRRATGKLGLQVGVPGFVDQLDQGQQLIRPGQQALP